MKNHPLAIAGLLPLLGSLAGCVASETSEVKPQVAEVKPQVASEVPSVKPTSDATKLAAGYNEFGFRLLRRLATDDKKDNLCLSPFSVATALAMTGNGAAGQTRQELETLLGAASLQPEAFNTANQNLSNALQGADAKTRFNVANSLWAKKSVEFKPAFLDAARRFFDAPVEAVDMQNPATLQRINDWTKQKTEGKIPRILQQLDGRTIMVLLNAIYFKGQWAEKFDPAHTANATFHTPKGDRPLPFMTLTKKFNYFENDELQAVALPYGNGRFAMWILLPRPKVTLDALLGKLNGQTWQAWTQPRETALVTIKLPKMKIEGDEDLEKVLPGLGAPSAFDASKADFSAMTDVHPVWIGQVKHKAVVEVDEEGTTAAAATAVAMRAGAAPKTFSFVADRPFLMAIQERDTQAILFLCRVTQP